METNADSTAPAESIVEPVLTDEQRAEARVRAEKCGQEIFEVLQHHNCRIIPFLRPVEWVGNDGSKAMISASYGVVPSIPKS